MMSRRRKKTKVKLIFSSFEEKFFIKISQENFGLEKKKTKRD
jgi:hypothetical protein